MLKNSRNGSVATAPRASKCANPKCATPLPAQPLHRDRRGRPTCSQACVIAIDVCASPKCAKPLSNKLKTIRQDRHGNFTCSEECYRDFAVCGNPSCGMTVPFSPPKNSDGVRFCSENCKTPSAPRKAAAAAATPPQTAIYAG